MAGMRQQTPVVGHPARGQLFPGRRVYHLVVEGDRRVADLPQHRERRLPSLGQRAGVPLQHHPDAGVAGGVGKVAYLGVEPLARLRSGGLAAGAARPDADDRRSQRPCGGDLILLRHRPAAVGRMPSGAVVGAERAEAQPQLVRLPAQVRAPSLVDRKGQVRRLPPQLDAVGAGRGDRAQRLRGAAVLEGDAADADAGNGADHARRRVYPVRQDGVAGSLAVSSVSGGCRVCQSVSS